MKKATVTLILIMCVIFVYSQTEFYYWYKEEKVYLTENKSKRFVLLENINNRDTLSRLIGNSWFIERIREDKTVQTLNGYYNNTIQTNLNWTILHKKNKSNEKINKSNEIIYDAPFFKNSQNEDLGLSHLFYIKLKKKEDLPKLEELAVSHSVEIIGNNKFMPLWYTLSCTKHSTGNAMTISNFFYETGIFSAAQPDLMPTEMSLSVNDPYYTSQWNMSNNGQYGGASGIDIDVNNAWGITMGDNTVVAVIDNGIEFNHPDLPNMYHLSYDTEEGTSPSKIYGDLGHGIACAGIIGAAVNDKGIAGIAPNCQLMSISIIAEATTSSYQKRADGINFAWRNGADVISCSWHAESNPYMDDAIDSALLFGRNGLGCVIVVAAGNTNSSYVRYPANSNPDIIAVGAMSMCAERKNPFSCDGENWGSNYGTDLDVVAPGVLIPTTDRQATKGYNPYDFLHTRFEGTLISSDFSDDDYTLAFTGTSAACPHVAGIAALILSVKPDLTQDQVRYVIESSCDKVNIEDYSYTSTSGRNNGTWNIEMGYGKVNAYKALKMVMATITGSSTVCAPNNVTFLLNDRQAGTTVNWTTSDNLEIVSGQGTNNFTVKPIHYAVNGTEWVEAAISTGGSEVVPVKKSFYVKSRPIISDSQIRGGYNNVPFNSTDNFYITAASGFPSYLWSIVPYSMTCSSDKLPYFISSYTRTSVSVKHGTCEGKYFLRCKAFNSCGSSYYQDKVINVYDPYGDDDPCDATLTLYPNPGKKEEFTILKIEYPDDPCDDEIYPYMAIDIDHELSLYDLSGNLVLQETFSSDSYTFRNADFKKDIYLVTIKDKKGKLHQKRLTIK
ncbi:MAG: S8 family serine peptidase [Bacteroidales bacterium]|nr:S8 family serine peptidase [Bacteroidales bacterium]